MFDVNPFYTRASEYIELDDKFLTLFSPEVLNIFTQNGFQLWDRVNIIRSSPGGGKTTLLRLFTPKTLKRLKETSRHDEHNREIFLSLKNIGAYDINGDINIVGSIISFNTEYRTIDYLQLGDTQKIRFFLSLVNIRIILSTLQAIYILKNYKSENEYKNILIDSSKITTPIPPNLRGIVDGLALYRWACDQEEIICKKIDSVYSDIQNDIEGTDSLYALDIFAPNNITINGNKLNERILLMFDDVHNLSPLQRTHLVSSVINKRALINVWISERLKALTMDELFSEGNTERRDMNTIHIEKYWAAKYAAFEKFAKSVANRRISLALDTPREFASFLSEDFDDNDIQKIETALIEVKDRVNKNYGTLQRYDSWILAKEELDADAFSQLVAWRSLEILLYRDKNKAQQNFSFDIELKEEQLDDQEGSDVKMAAHLFLNIEYKIPFYYSISKVCRLSSFNIEQFLAIAGYFYEEIKNNQIKQVVNSNHKLEISPKRQEQIINTFVTKAKWNELINKVPNFSKIRIFLDSIGSFCYNETYVPNAWNSPGLNGVAILMSDRDLLKDVALKDKTHIYYSLAKCIADCISYNLLDFELNYRCKNKTWMLLYLNKIYCAKYNLPLNNGGFKEKKLNDFLQWYNIGYKQKTVNKLSI